MAEEDAKRQGLNYVYTLMRLIVEVKPFSDDGKMLQQLATEEHRRTGLLKLTLDERRALDQCRLVGDHER